MIKRGGVPAPEVIAEEILGSLQSAVEEIQAVLESLNKDKTSNLMTDTESRGRVRARPPKTPPADKPR
jgi:hypothetical protein